MRTQQLEKEIKEFELKRYELQEKFQQDQAQFQQILLQIKEAIDTRRGGIIELQRLEETEEEGEP